MGSSHPPLAMEPAHEGDVDAVLVLRDELARWLLERGIEQWRPGELPRAWLQDWIGEGRVHVLRHEERPIASVVILTEDVALWGPQGADPHARYVHLLMVDRAWAGQRLGDRVLAWAEQRMRDEGAEVARLDAVRDNTALHRWYEDRGYHAVGHHPGDPDHGWSPALLREKRLTG